MVAAAVGLGTAVKTAGAGTFPKLTDEMAHLINDGNPLSEVMGRYPHYFTDYEVAIVKCGEYSGTLDYQLKHLADELEKSYRLQQQLSAKCVYPMLVLHLAIFIPPLAIIVTKGLHAYLQMTLGMLIPMWIIAGIFFTMYKVASQAGFIRSAMDTILVHTPILGTPFKLLAVTRFLRTYTHLQEAGVLPNKAIDVACSSCGNAHIASVVRGTYNRMGMEARLSQVMIRSQVFPSVIGPMVATGEESGQLAPLLGKAADMIQQDMEISIHRIATVLPVVLLLFVGGIVGYRVISVFSGITSMIFNV